jgi:glutathione S-transferase
MSLKLYQWPSNGDLPNSGVFCMKLESYLKLAQIPHEVVSTTSMGKSPKKTMPAIDMNGTFMSDSQLIIEHLEKTSKQPIDGFLSKEQQATANTYRRMLEHHLVNIMIYFRWAPEAGWKQFSHVVFGTAPALVRALVGPMVRKGSVKRLQTMGIGRHAPDELVAFAKQDIESIASLLGEKKFIFGDTISTLDLTLYSVIANILYGNVEMPLIALVKSQANLVQHASRVMKQVYGRDFKNAAN